MKKLQLLLLSFVVATMAFAQHAKGDIYLGGNLNFGVGSSNTKVGNTKNEGPKTFNLGIQPKVGYFISDKFSVGVDLGFSTRNTKIDNLGTTTTYSNMAFGGGIFARYYVMPVEKFGFFFEANAGAMAGSSKTKIGAIKTDGPNTLEINAGITPGIVVYVSNRVALEANYGFLGYTSSTSTDKSGPQDIKDNQGDFGLNINPSTFKFGVSILF